jgi:hypothetical protein
VLLGAPHAGSQVLEEVHVKATASVTGWVDPLASPELLHSCDHFQLEWTAVIFFLRCVFGGGSSEDGVPGMAAGVELLVMLLLLLLPLPLPLALPLLLLFQILYSAGSEP